MYILGIEDVPRHNKVTAMEVKLPVLVMLAMALSLFSDASAEQVLAVYYNPKYYHAACPIFTMKNSGVMIAGVRDELGNNGTACGRMLTVRCAKPADGFPHPSKDSVVTVKVVDYCRQLCNGVISLSRDAFATPAKSGWTMPRKDLETLFLKEKHKVRGTITKVTSALMILALPGSETN